MIDVKVLLSWLVVGVLLLIALTEVESKSLTAVADSDEQLNINHRSKRDVNKANEEEVKDPSCQPNIYSYTIESDIKYRYAKTVSSSKVANPCHSGREVSFTLTLPESAYISEFLLIIKDKTYKAYVKEKEEAKKVYDDAKKAGSTAAHVELSARDSNIFTVSVNVEASSKVAFNLTYEQLLQRTLGVYEHTININPGQVVAPLDVIVNIKESSPLTVLEVSEFKTENEISESTGNKEAKISRQGDDSAKIKWSPSAEEQKLASKDGLKGQLIVRYDVDRKKESSQILVQDGFFVHFFAPSDLQKLPKYLIFILDISGSMSGQKLIQLKEAMNQILTEVTSEDYFTIITFSSSVQAWLPSSEGNLSSDKEINQKHIVRATEDNVKAAVHYINGIRILGATNIIDALRQGVTVAELGKKLHSDNEPIIFFLTDGEPNVEESDPKAITKKITALNQNIQCPIFSLALGSGADYKFLTSLSLSNSGFARKIYVASDTHLQLKNFYKQIASPLLSNVSFHYVPEQVDKESITKSTFPNFFSGSELAIAGKLSSSNQNGNIGVELAAHFKKCETCRLPAPVNIIIKKPEESVNGLERLWAYAYIRQLLEEDAVNGTKDSSSKKKALALSLQYAFVTPLTSLVVVKPNETEASAIKSADDIEHSGHPSQIQPLSLPGAPFYYMKAPIPVHDHYSNAAIRGPPGQYGSKITSGGVPYSDSARPLIVGGTVPPRVLTTRFTTEPLNSTTGLPSPVIDTTAKKNLTIDDISWLKNSTIKIPSSSDTIDFIVESHNPNVAYQNCTVPNYGQGYCRYIKFCVLPEITKSYTDYLPYSCTIHNKYAGVCCPGTFKS